MAKIIRLSAPGASGATGAGSTPASLQLAPPASQAQVGALYGSTVVATGGVLPYTFSITVGSLPAGLSLNTSTGAITGTPATAGAVTFTVQVADSASTSASLSCTINVAQQSGASLPPPTVTISSTVGRDVGHATDTPTPDTRLEYFQLGVKANYSATPNQYGTVFLSRDGGTNWYGIGWYLWTASGQEFFILQVRPVSSATWKIAVAVGTIQFDAVNPISTATLTGLGGVPSAGFTVAAIALPSATSVSSLTVTTGTGGDPNFPYDKLDGQGSHFFSILSATYSDATAVADPNAFFVRLTAQDYDASGNPIGPELPWSGTQVSPNGVTLSWGPLEGNYGIYGWTYTRPGNLCKVRLRVYVANRINQGSNSFADPTSAVLQTSVGGGAGYVDVTVAVGGAIPNGAITTNQIDPTQYTSLVQTRPNIAVSVLNDPSFEYSTAGLLGSGAGNAPGWDWSQPPGSSIEIKSDGGNSGPNYARLTGPNTYVAQTIPIQPGLGLYVQFAARSSNTAGASHAIGLYVTWLDANSAPLSPYTAVIGTVSGFVSAWTNNALSGYTTAPTGAAFATIKIETSGAEPGYWDVDDLQYQPTIQQTGSGQTGTTVPVTSSVDQSFAQATAADGSSGYYGRLLAKLSASNGRAVSMQTSASGGAIFNAANPGVSQASLTDSSMFVEDNTAANAIFIELSGGVPTVVIVVGGSAFTGYTGTVQAAYAANKPVKAGWICN